GETLVLSVRDTGAGVAPERIGALFGKFTQADASTTRRYGGTGLGLAICRELCELMGGAIRAESTLGEGSTFIAELPLPRVGEAHPIGFAPPPPPSAELEPHLPKIRVLAAEDN